MPTVQRDQFNINYEVTIPGDGPTLLLVGGLSEQIGSLEYPVEQCQIFADMGFRVVRMDNRDQGLSIPTVPDTDVEDYNHLDVAADIAAVIDDLGVDSVHLVGASMGGFLVRWTAIIYPEKIKTLTVVMSGSGSNGQPGIPFFTDEVMDGLSEFTIYRNKEDQVAWNVQAWRNMWGDHYEFDEEWIADTLGKAYDRAYRVMGTARQLRSAQITTGLYYAQTQISCPTLVMHGGSDNQFTPDHAEATASQIPNSTLWIDPHMGHIMHKEQWQEMAERIATMAGLR